MRQFSTGACRDTDENKMDYEGFLSPFVLERFAEYMHKHRVQADGNLRDSDNWQKGIPEEVYMKSLFRHFMEVWIGYRTGEIDQDALCACLFNLQGLLHESLVECENAEIQESEDSDEDETVQDNSDRSPSRLCTTDCCPNYGGCCQGNDFEPFDSWLLNILIRDKRVSAEAS